MDPLFFYNVGGFIISDRGFDDRIVNADAVIAVDMDFGEETERAVILDSLHAGIRIDADHVGVAEIMRISVGKIVVPAFDGKIADAVAVQNIDLHAVIRHEQMIAAFHDFMSGVVKQIVDIKGIDDVGTVIIKEKLLFDINRIFDIEFMVPEIHQSNAFFKRQRKRRIGIRQSGGIIQYFLSFQVGVMRL